MEDKNIVLERLFCYKNVFLTGGAGVGKTTVTKAVIAAYESEAKNVAKLASTGMAATLIGGQTLHSFLDFGIASNFDELQKIGKFEAKKRTKDIIKSMDLIVIDEISMVSGDLFEMVEMRLNESGFKGSLLVVGDFLQLPPVSYKNRAVLYAFESSAWKNFDFETIELTRVYRSDDKAFVALLNHIRFGEIDEDSHRSLNSFVKPLPNNLNRFTFLFGKNISAIKHNKKELDNLCGEFFVKEAQIIKEKQNINDKEIERFMNDARIEKELELKIGAPVLFTRNSWNYFNGEQGKIVNRDERYLYVQKSDQKIVKVEQVAQSKIVWSQRYSNGKEEIFQEELFRVLQYPLRLSFAITIHKAQGMSIENLIIEPKEIFAPSQFYVAISRASNPHHLTLLEPNRAWRELVFVDYRAIKFYKNFDMF